MCIEFDDSFEELAEMCAALTMYAVQPRYPYEADLNANHAKQAIEYAKKIKVFVPLAELYDK